MDPYIRFQISDRFSGPWIPLSRFNFLSFLIFTELSIDPHFSGETEVVGEKLATVIFL